MIHYRISRSCHPLSPDTGWLKEALIHIRIMMQFLPPPQVPLHRLQEGLVAVGMVDER